MRTLDSANYVLMGVMGMLILVVLVPISAGVTWLIGATRALGVRGAMRWVTDRYREVYRSGVDAASPQLPEARVVPSEEEE